MTSYRIVPGYALLRLLWRPMSVFLLLVAVRVVVFPWAFLPDESGSWMDPPQSPLHGTKFQFALWRDCVLLPIVTGGLLSGMTHEALLSGVSWMLPRYRPRLLQATVLTAMLFALLVSVAIALLISWRAGIAAFGIGTLSFGIGWRVFDPAASNVLRFGAAVAVFATVARPAYLLAAVEANPGTIALLATLGGIGLLWNGLTTRHARGLAFRPRPVGGLLELLKGDDKTPWEKADGHVVPPAFPGLIRAGIYESTGISRLGRLQAITLQIVFFSVFGWIFRSSSMVASLPMLLVGLLGIQLKDVFSYPISRRQRADAFFVASLVDSVSMAAFAAGAVLLLVNFGWWRESPSPTVRTPGDALIGLLFLFLFVPISQLALTSGPFTSSKKRRISTRRAIVMACAAGVWFVAALIARDQLGPLINQNPPLLVAAVILFSFLVIQIAFWASLRFFFGRRNLG